MRQPRKRKVFLQDTPYYHCNPGSGLDDDASSLEVGIGCGALISLSLSKVMPLNSVGVDLSSERVRTSREVAEFNGLEGDFFESDLLSAVPPESRFDLIFFNPPYVPTETGHQLKLTERLGVDEDQVWDGGSDGTEVLRKFLIQAVEFLSPKGRIVFGVQPIFVPEEMVHTVLEDVDMVLAKRITKRLVPSVAYVVEPNRVGVHDRQPN